MYSNHFYHKVTKTAVAVFGSLFNNLTVVRQDGAGNTLNQIKVPLAYGPKQKFLARIDQPSGNDASLAIKLPRMSFEITSIQYDESIILPKFSSITETISDKPNEKLVINSIVPYKISFQLSVMAKNQDDALQILEQIIPVFRPEYVVTIKPLKDVPSYRQDVPIVLNSVSFSDDYEGDFNTRRAIIYTFEFEMRVRYFGPVGQRAVIKEVDVTTFDFDDAALFNDIEVKINPLTATENDTFNIDVNITDYE